MNRLYVTREKRCENCKWHDTEFSWVCANGESPKVADFTDNDDSCEEWESDRETKKRASKSQNG